MNSPAQRQNILELIEQATQAGSRLDKACDVIGIKVRTIQRWKTNATGVDARVECRHSPVNRLSEQEEQTILDTCNSPEYAHLPPSQIVPLLADKGVYIGSESTIYRCLRKAKQNKNRSTCKTPVKRHKPRALCATGPNQIYSWDITYLPTTIRGIYFYLYIVLDVFSRKIVGWQVYAQESGDHASDLLIDICIREKISKDQVVLHSDNGASMKSSTLQVTLNKLGIASSFSRPSVSNDNPYSESLFKTLKYRPDYQLLPFEDLLSARHSVSQLVDWYNNEHRHSAIQFVTPDQRHQLLDEELLNKRDVVYKNAQSQHPRRWTGLTRNWQRVKVVHLNPEKSSKAKLNRQNQTQEQKAA